MCYLHESDAVAVAAELVKFDPAVEFELVIAGFAVALRPDLYLSLALSVMSTGHFPSFDVASQKDQTPKAIGLRSRSW